MAVMIGYVVISYYAAYIAKAGGIKKKWLPLVAATTGLACGIVGHVVGMTNGNIFDSIALGIFSGFSAVGTNEIAKYTFVRKE